METKKLNIALRFNNDAIDEIWESLEFLDKEFEFKYILNKENAIPHITLFQGLFPEKNIDNLAQAISDIAGNTRGFKLKFKDLVNFKSSVWAEFIKNPEVSNLHARVVEDIQPLREGLVEPQFESTHPVYQSLTVTRRKMVDEYGYPHLFEMFEPHISLMKLVDREMVFIILDRINWRIKELAITKLAIYDSGEEATAKGLIREFNLED